MKPPSAKLCGLWVLLCLSSGLLSYALFPAVPEVQGNRRLAAAPTAPLGTAEWFQQSALWLRERLPLRLASIQTKNNALLSAAQAWPQLGVSPGSRSVFVGQQGWLFFDQDAAVALSPKVHKEMAAKCRQLADRFTASGRRFIFMPIPDKLSLFPDYAPDLLRNADRWSLAEQMPVELRSVFQTDSQRCFIDLWQHFSDYRRQQGDDFWCPEDTHWNSKGGLLAVRQILDRLSPGLATDADFRDAGQRPMVNDLRSSLLLLPGEGQLAPYYKAQRSVSPQETERLSLPDLPSTPIVSYESKHPQVIPGNTLVVMDSFILSVPHLLAPWFEKVTFIHETYAQHPIMRERLTAADTIIWTSVERILRGRVDYWATMPPLPAK
jgi:hypothetical protein